MSDKNRNRNLPSDYDEQFIRDIMEDTRRANETIIYQQAMMQQQQMMNEQMYQQNNHQNMFPPVNPFGPM